MREQSSAFGRIAKAVTSIWQDAVAGQAALLARPWDVEGELRWVSGPGGPRLVGGELPAGRRRGGRRAAREVALATAREAEAAAAALRRAQ